MKRLILSVGLLPILILPLISEAASTKKYDGIITRVNLLEGTLNVRLRDGSPATFKLPFESGMFLSANGNMDISKRILDGITSIVIKGATSTDAIPTIGRISPGAGIPGDKITLIGSGFTRKNNSVSIDGNDYAAINIPSKEGQSITFGIPPMPCNQRADPGCTGLVITPGAHEFYVMNGNGKSNPIPFTVNPLPPLSIKTETVPEAVSGIKYEMNLAGEGGPTTYVWKISKGFLPLGVILKNSFCKEIVCRQNANIYGVPLIPGTYNFTVSLASGGETASRDYALVVNRNLNLPVY